MTKLNTLKDGLVDGLKDLYHAEHQLLKALPKMEKRATNPKLKILMQTHLKETEGQVERLSKIESLMKIKLTGKICKAMQGLRVLVTLALLSTTAVSTGITFAESHTAKNQNRTVNHKADNTGRNADSSEQGRKTADDQPVFGNETELLAKIRSKIVDNDKLSTFGKNVKIIIEGGSVTLRGPVVSLSESAWIEKASKSLAPNYMIVNELEVASS